MKSAVILGLMSGTSLDGLDLCLTEFQEKDGRYNFKILNTLSVNYSPEWQARLRTATELTGAKLSLLNIDVALYFGDLVNDFLKTTPKQPNYIASHGHTIFHQPDKGLTLQIGDGATLFTKTNIPVIYDFRSLDVALGGQGAPLVPIGDLHLFSEFAACVNFGGIANISYQKNTERLAYDICPVNMVLSDLTAEINLPYDDKGVIAKSGEIHNELLAKLNSLEFYKNGGPKSLGVEWYIDQIQPLIKNKQISVENRLRTVIEHIADQISSVLGHIGEGEVLVTGGGVYNEFLIAVVQSKINQKLVVPSRELIDFKEALIFAFLGWLKMNGKVNVLKSVTGASRDSSGGVIIN